MRKHRFKKILDDMESGKPDDFQSVANHTRAVNQLKAASAASVEWQNQGVSRFSGNGEYLLSTAMPDPETAEEACPPRSRPAASAGMTLQQLKQALKTSPARAELNRLRRRFALANHPDRACDNRREILSARLSVANGLIDEALKNTRR